MYSTPEQFSVPTPCPNCGGKMTSREWKVILKILRQRSWICCTECDFEETADQFKERLLTV